MRALRSTVTLLLVVGLLGCASASPRHVATGASTALTDALVGLQQTADAAVAANGLTAAKRQALAAHLLPALQAGHDLNTAVLDWKPGDPVPANLKTLAQNVGALVTDIVGDFSDPATQAKAAAFVAAANAALVAFFANQ